jgi:hypothetical protein
MVGAWFTLKLPTLGESAANLPGGFQDWFVNGALPAIPLSPLPPYNDFDAWTHPFPYTNVDPVTGVLNSCLAPPIRIGEDVLLTNVIGFDVKAWDPGAPVLQYPSAVSPNPNPALLPGDPGYAAALTAHQTSPGNPAAIGFGAYVDLGFMPTYDATSIGEPQPLFSRLNYDPATGPPSQPGPRSNLERVYDTWSTHYEGNGFKEVGNTSGLTTDAGTNGFDDDGNGVVDEAAEQETSAPYPVPLRGIQIKIRIFEPDSRQIREVTVVQRF